MKQPLSVGKVVVVTILVLTAHAERSLTFCDLVRNPAEYQGREVTIRASYQQGFEWQELYCLDCLEQGKAWLDLDGLDDASERALKHAPKGAGIVNLPVRGSFYTGGHYGHENGYRHKFLATEIRDVVVVVKGELVSDKKKAAEKQ